MAQDVFMITSSIVHQDKKEIKKNYEKLFLQLDIFVIGMFQLRLVTCKRSRPFCVYSTLIRKRVTI